MLSKTYDHETMLTTFTLAATTDYMPEHAKTSPRIHDHGIFTYCCGVLSKSGGFKSYFKESVIQ